MTGMDGVLLIYPFPDQIILGLRSFRWFRSFSSLSGRSDCVDADHHRGIELVLNHLVELGHERIGFLTTGYDLSPYLVPSFRFPCRDGPVATFEEFRLGYRSNHRVDFLLMRFINLPGQTRRE